MMSKETYMRVMAALWLFFQAVGWLVSLFAAAGALSAIFIDRDWLDVFAYLVLGALFLPPLHGRVRGFIEKKLHANYPITVAVAVTVVLKTTGWFPWHHD